MAVYTADDAVPEIRGWIQENVTGSREIPEEELLIEKGYLTSLQTVELVMFLEDRFGINVEDEEFSEENFGTIRAIAELVESKTE
jgi:acyl carrier protein